MTEPRQIPPDYEEIERIWPDRKDFRERTPAPPAQRPAARRPSPLQREARIEPFRAKDGYINIFGHNPFDKEAAND